MKHLLVLLTLTLIVGCEDLAYIAKSPQERTVDSSSYFTEFKDIDLSGEPLDCRELIEFTAGPTRFSFDVVDFEYHEKYSFQQCRSEINVMIEAECDHNVKANYYYEQRDVFTSERTNYFCSDKIDKVLNKSVLSKSDVEQLLAKALIKVPSYSSFINLRMLKAISTPKQKIKKGFYAVRLDMGDSLDEKYFLYFNNIETADYFIDKVSDFLNG